MKQSTAAVPFIQNTGRYWIILTAVIFFAGTQKGWSQQNQMAKMKQAAIGEDTIKMTGEQVRLQQPDPFLKTNSKTPVPYRIIPMKVRGGRAIQPNETVTMKDGSKVAAPEFFRRLNDAEKKLNAQGYTLQGTGKIVIGSVVTPASDLDGRIAESGKPLRKLRSESEVDTRMKPTGKVGTITLKPFDTYTPAEKDKLSKTMIELKNGKAVAKAIAVPAMASPAGERLLNNFSKTITKDWHFGNNSTFLAGINGTVTLKGKIYTFNPQSPGTNKSEFQVLADARAYASLFGHSVDVATGHLDAFAPEDVSKKMTLKVQIKIGGISVLNLDESYAQSKSFSGVKSRNVSKSFGIQIPIGWGFDFTGRIGLDGTFGIKYSGNLFKTFASAQCRPYCDIKGKAEAGVDFLHVLGGGVGGKLTLLSGNLDLSGYIGVWSQNANQIVLVYSYYFGYNLEVLKGELYCYIEACFIGCWRPVEFTFFRWNGFKQAGTFAEDMRIIPIANL